MMELPLYPTLESTRLAAEHCCGCARSMSRTHVVFGHGDPDSKLMLVGESPSETDDRTGRPFSGPAGRLLDRLLNEIGLSRHDVWITNLIRCHSGVMRNGRVENKPPLVSEIRSCATWIELETRYLDPAIIVAIGATAAKHLIDPKFKLREQRGIVHELAGGLLALATIQPAYVMRLATIDPGAEYVARHELLTDLRLAAILAGILNDEGYRRDVALQ